MSAIAQDHRVQVTVQVDRDAQLLVPAGLSTPHATPRDMTVTGADVHEVIEGKTGQRAHLLSP